jgi:hypothetical protein
VAELGSHADAAGRRVGVRNSAAENRRRRALTARLRRKVPQPFLKLARFFDRTRSMLYSRTVHNPG